MTNDALGYIDFRVFERDYSLSRRTFFKLIADGKLSAYKPSKRKTLVKRADVDRLLEQYRAEQEEGR
jgi:excisionase family DNA binding protein